MAALTRDSRRRGVELGFTATTGALASIPSFLLAVALVYLFAVTIQHLSGRRAAAASRRTCCRSPRSRSRRSPSLSRIVRVEGLRVLDQDYIRTARGKRLPARLVYVRHALPEHADADPDAGRPAARRADRRHRPRREHLRVARPRDDARPVGGAEGLPDRAGASRVVFGSRRPARQLRRRHRARRRSIRARRSSIRERVVARAASARRCGRRSGSPRRSASR